MARQALHCWLLLAALSAGPAAAIKTSRPTSPKLTSSDTYNQYMEDTLDVVGKWEVNPARHTDSIAVTILQPVNETTLQLFNYAIRANMHRLGPDWALQIFFATEEDKEAISELLEVMCWNHRSGSANIIWTPIIIQGQRMDSLTPEEANWFRLSTDFWGEIKHRYEHVLIFEADSLLLKAPGCVEQFFDYKYVGAPWNRSIPLGRQTAPLEGGSGGLSLHSRTTSVEMVNSEFNRKNLGYKCTPNCKFPKRHFPTNRDGAMLSLFTQHNHTIASRSFPARETAMEFAVEQLYHPDPCGVNKPWEFISKEQADELLAGADMA